MAGAGCRSYERLRARLTPPPPPARRVGAKRASEERREKAQCAVGVRLLFLAAPALVELKHQAELHVVRKCAPLVAVERVLKDGEHALGGTRVRGLAEHLADKLAHLMNRIGSDGKSATPACMTI